MGENDSKNRTTMTTLERQFAQTVAEQKSTIYTVCYMFSQDADWLFFGVPAVILWFGWFVYEIYLTNGHDLSLSNPFFLGGCCGGVIGAICGYKMHFKTQRQYQEIIDQIEDLTAE